MMVDLVPVALSATFFLTGVGVGRRWRAKSTTDTAPATCPCSHAVGYHEQGAGACRAEVKRPAKWNSYGEAISYAWVRCNCQCYAGPELVSSLTMRPVAFRAVTADEQPRDQ